MLNVRKTRKEAPPRVLLHGSGGVGKSTFAAAAPSPIFIASEDGLANIDAHAFAECTTWTDMLSQVNSLVTGDHAFKTLVIDSLDWLEPMCWAHTCLLGSKKDIEAFGYGKGYAAALDHWRVFLSRLGAVRERGIGIVLIAHSVRKTVKNPEGDDYEQWQIKLHDKASELIKEWVDVVGFASHEVATFENDNGRTKGIATGKRVLKTAPAAGYVGKTRFAMPASMPLDWPTFERAVRDGGAGALDRLKGEFEARLAELADADVEEKARAFVASRGETVASMSEAVATVTGYLAEKRKAS